MTTAAVFEYSPGLLAKIHLLFSPTTCFASIQEEKKKKIHNTVLLNTSPDVRGTPLFKGYLLREHLAEIQRAMHFENDNHLTVDFL